MKTKAENKKILITYATAGIGHTKAALAVEEALRHKGIGCEVADVLDYTNAFVSWLFHRFYILLVKYTPTIWALVYHALDIPAVFKKVNRFRSFLNRMNSKKFADYLCRLDPDVVASTHVFTTEIVSSLK